MRNLIKFEAARTSLFFSGLIGLYLYRKKYVSGMVLPIIFVGWTFYEIKKFLEKISTSVEKTADKADTKTGIHAKSFSVSTGEMSSDSKPIIPLVPGTCKESSRQAVMEISRKVLIANNQAFENRAQPIYGNPGSSSCENVPVSSLLKDTSPSIIRSLQRAKKSRKTIKRSQRTDLVAMNKTEKFNDDNRAASSSLVPVSFTPQGEKNFTSSKTAKKSVQNSKRRWRKPPGGKPRPAVVKKSEVSCREIEHDKLTVKKTAKGKLKTNNGRISPVHKDERERLHDRKKENKEKMKRKKAAKERIKDKQKK